ncbi:MAG: SRPBCC family protein [Acidimicrobiia bacterium]|nr:SRPBCC family protein [Acidimicrobiia bacterium]
MRITSEFEVGESPDRVWDFFNNIPAVAASLPGADISEQVDEDSYRGSVVIALGPVRLNFAGEANVIERDEASRKIVVDATGSDAKGRGQAAMVLTARVEPLATGSKVMVDQDLQLSGAAAQYGRGMVQDVTAVLLDQFASNMKAQLGAIESGEEVTVAPTSASGFSIGLKAIWMALKRVARRFFLPYEPVT